MAATAGALDPLAEGRDVGVDDPLHALAPGLRRIVEDDEAGAQRDVLLAHRRQAVGLVLDRVVLRPDAEEAPVEQAQRGGEDALVAHVVALEVGLDALAQAGERASEAQHLVELLLVATLAPLGVVEVLLAPPLVDAGGLDVAAWVWADPHVLPRGRDDQLVDAREDLGLAQPLAVGVEVDEAPARPA